jgi:hypothetical protein
MNPTTDWRRGSANPRPSLNVVKLLLLYIGSTVNSSGTAAAFDFLLFVLRITASSI